MTDIVERLRACQGVLTHDPECNCDEAADEIERQLAEIDRLQAEVKELFANNGDAANEIGRLRANEAAAIFAFRETNDIALEEIKRLRTEVEWLREVVAAAAPKP